jgi:2,5-furandicarboxylate decarboxylase 1
MRKNFRDFLRDLETAGELQRIRKPVDVRDVSALLGHSARPTLFENLKDYPGWRLAGALISSRQRLALAMGCSVNEIATRFERGFDRLVDPVMVKEAPCQQIVLQGADVDLTAIPYPLLHVLDGGAYLSATFVVSKDAEYGRNVGTYRLMYRTPTETGIDLVTASDLRVYYQRKFERGEPLEIAVAIGLHPCEMLASSYKAPIHLDEYRLAGGLHGAPVPIVKCKTVDLEVPADAELVLEGELLPTGWTADEGPFGEFSQMSGDVKWNPIFRAKCITHRRDPIFYLAQMPGEGGVWLTAPVVETAGLRALRNASVQPVAIRAPVGGCGYWTLVASIKKRPGEGKNALLALLSVAGVKLAIVTDDDINIDDPDDLDWALTFRVQADRDLIVVEGARGKHIDPSVRAWELGKGALPTTAKLGIPATIPEGVPRKLYKRLHSYGRDRVRLADSL